MASLRKPFQGVWNIIRFNWHFYLLSFGVLLTVFVLAFVINDAYKFYLIALGLLIAITTFISLAVSFFVYDLSGLYELTWVNEVRQIEKGKLVNINAGFDETSLLLQEKFKGHELIVFDFYDPLKHTEVSIKRARKAYPPYPNTVQVSTTNLPLKSNHVDRVFVILSAHEIRNEAERVSFFKELNRILDSDGQIVVVEHLRDIPNFLAYNIGFFHFHSKGTWRTTFEKAKLKIVKELKITPFISTFILEKYGAAS